MPNIWNTDSVNTYLESFSDDDDVLLQHLKTALHRPLLLEESCIQKIDTVPDNAPSWLTNKWNQQHEWHEWSPSNYTDGKVKHIKDWIEGAMISGDDWLEKTDDKGRPKKLLSISTLEQATQKANKAMRLAAQKFSDLEDDEDAIRPIRYWEKERMTLVQLLTPEALRRESRMMGHCIGHGKYDDDVKFDEIAAYSLRDHKNRAHVTLDILTKTNALLECKGKENRPPIAKYMPFVQEFIADQKCIFYNPTEATGLIEQDGIYYDILNLPKDFIYNGRYLDLSRTNITELPEGFKCNGSLGLNHTDIIELPEGFSCSGSLDLRHTKIKKLPEGFSCSGDINLADSDIAELPVGFTCHGNLNLSKTNITELPEGFSCSGDLDLSDTDIAELPEGFTCNGNINLYNTNITELPEGFACNGNLNLAYSDIAELPEGFSCNGDLNICDTDITTLPKDIIVKGRIFSPDGSFYKSVEQFREALESKSSGPEI